MVMLQMDTGSAWALHNTLIVERDTIEHMMNTRQDVSLADVESQVTVALGHVYQQHGQQFPQGMWERQCVLFKINILSLWQHRDTIGRKTA